MLNLLKGRCIYKSPLGVRVYQTILYRWITFETAALQTKISRINPKKIQLNYVHQLTLAARQNQGKCCLLGLGGAAVAHALSPFGNEILAIEKNLDVIDIAKNYFMTDSLKKLNIIHQDARLFVEECQQQFQHLLIDLYDATSFPNECNNAGFFSHCRRLLMPEGTLAINLAGLNDHWPIFLNIKEQFPHNTVCLPVNGTANIVILASNHKSINPLIDLLKKQKGLKKLAWDSKWGYVAQID